MGWGNRTRQGGNQRRATIKRIMQRDGYTCACGRPATEVDHIVNLASGGTHDDANLRAICRACHKIKTDAEATRGRVAFNAKRWRPSGAHPGDV